MFVSLEDFESIEEAPSSVDSNFFNGWLMVEVGDWVSEGKWDSRDCIVQHVPTDKYYQYSLSRSGSYYSDYYYSHIEDDNGVHLNEVIPYEETIVVKKWRGV